MTKRRIPGLCERYKTDNGIHDLESNQILPRSVKQMDVYVYIH